MSDFSLHFINLTWEGSWEHICNVVQECKIWVWCVFRDNSKVIIKCKKGNSKYDWQITRVNRPFKSPYQVVHDVYAFTSVSFTLIRRIQKILEAILHWHCRRYSTSASIPSLNSIQCHCQRRYKWCFWGRFYCDTWRGARYLMGENLKIVSSEFLSLS